MTTLRVRQIIEGMDSTSRTNLKKFLPPSLSIPDVKTERYPSAILSSLPKELSYSYLGIVAEALLRLPSTEIHVDALITSMKQNVPGYSSIAETKVRKSKTTQPFLDSLVKTRAAVESVLRAEEGPLRFEEEIISGSVAGHPDMRNATQIFEIKLTGLLKKNWPSFLLQAFAYAAIVPEAKDLYIVLPLQQMVWKYELSAWKKRKEFMNALSSWSTTQQTDGMEAMIFASILRDIHSIGWHVGKKKNLANSIATLGDYSRPYQIFLGGPQNSKMTIADDDLAATLGIVIKNNAKIYVHSQYIINLSNKIDTWHVSLLQKNLQYTRTFGGKGVVVHVGKSTTQPLAEALEHMRSAIVKTIEFATEDCPLLLETPAGQGTELLTGMSEFLDFVASFDDPRLRICVDTCHVFACGHNPLEYITAAAARPNLLKLVHFNDSHGACGSCVDRHAHIGTGKIGIDGMANIAKLCTSHKFPMIIE